MYDASKKHHLDYTLKVSFAFPVLNEEKDLERCLKSIRSQNYPAEKIEIVIADGGSSDQTIAIAERYHCTIIKNPFVKAEPGAVLAHDASTGDIKVFFAADNALPDANWIKRMVKPFVADEDIAGAYTPIVVSEDDNSLNKYYSFLHVEPFTWFVYGDTCNPKNFHNAYSKLESADGFEVFEFTPESHPLIALAQGFCLRGDIDRKRFNHEDDVLPVIKLIEEGRKFACVLENGVYHYHVRGLSDFFKKYKWRVNNSLTKTDVGYASREKYLSKPRRIRQYLWMLYGLSIIAPAVQSLYWLFLRRRFYVLWHAPICFSLCLIILDGLTKSKLRPAVK